MFGFPEFVRSGDGVFADASLELEAEELTDIEVAGAAAALSRAASWSPVTHTGFGHLRCRLRRASARRCLTGNRILHAGGPLDQPRAHKKRPALDLARC